MTEVLNNEIRESYDAEKARAYETLNGYRDAYERKFQTISIYSPPAGPIKFSAVPVSTTDGPYAVGIQRELFAKGDSPAEAIAKWKEKLDACPQEGDLLLWRVQPEIEWTHDFAMQKPVWRVYARITV